MAAAAPGGSRPARVRRLHPVGTTGVLLASILLLLASAIRQLGVSHLAAGQHRSAAALAGEALALVIGHYPASLSLLSPVPPLAVARVLLPLLAGAAVALVAWRRVRNPVRLWLASRSSGHLVIAGDELIAAEIVRGERRSSSSVIILTETARPDWVARAADRGAAHLVPHDGAHLGRYLRRARLVVLAGNDAQANVDLAASLAGAAGAHEGRAWPLPIMVRVDDVSRREPFERSLAERTDPEQVQFRLMSLPNLIARTLLRGDVVDRVSRLGAARRTVVVLGYTAITEHYLVQLLVGGHFRDGRDLELVVMSAGAGGEARFRAAWPFAAGLARLRFVDAPDDMAATAAAIADLDPCAIILDAGDDADCRVAVAAIDAVFRERDSPPPAYGVHLATDEAVAVCAPVLAYGGAIISAHAELLQEEQHESLARAIHDFYLEGRLDEGEEIGSRAAVQMWERLPESIRDDNRLVVDLYGLKLRDVGARVLPGRGAALAFDREELEDLARGEHRRWMAARVLHGWRHGDERREAERRHPDLVPYDRLGDDTRQRDHEQVRITIRLLGRIGQHAARDLYVSVAAGRTANLRARIDALRRAYPDRAPVLIGDFRDPAARAVLLAGHEMGLPVRLCVDGHPDNRLAGCDPRQAARLRSMVRDVDRIVVPAPGTDPAATIAALAHVALADG